MASNLIAKPKKPDTSFLRAQEERLAKEEQIARDEERQKAQLQARSSARQRHSGRSSLLTGGETGVKRTTLG